MRFIKRLFNRIFAGKPSRPEDIPKKISAEALTAALSEARFLRGHAVDVKALAPDELPGLPKIADKQ